MFNPLPSLFKTRLLEIFTPQEQQTIDQAFSLTKRPLTLRINLHLSNAEEVEKELSKSFTYKKWFLPYSYIIDWVYEKDIWNLDIYKEWKIYLQSLSSQIPVHYMWLREWMYVLDATAAPGGKTSQISERVWDTWKVIACELSAIRREKMIYNLNKLHCENVEVVWGDASELGKIYTPETFDALLFDAPCTWEGSILYGDTKFLQAWDEKHIKTNYLRQKQILTWIIPLLKKEWILVYSTCTLEPEENESIVHFILCNFPELSICEIELEYPYKKNWIKKFRKYIYKNDVEKAVRIIPNPESEWFFIAKFIKN